jgi:hypothetical protein
MKRATLTCVFFLIFNNIFCQDLDELFYVLPSVYFQPTDYEKYAQSIGGATIVPDSKKIHVVILSDGYPQDPYTDSNGNVVVPRQAFADDFLDLVNTFKENTPFKIKEQVVLATNTVLGTFSMMQVVIFGRELRILGLTSIDLASH